MNHKRDQILLLAVLMLAAVFVPLVSATNETDPTPPGWIGKFDQWAGQEDMSAYSVIVPTVPIKRMDAQTAKVYPGVEVISPEMKFPTGNNVVDVQKSSMKAAKINFIKPALKTGAGAKTATVVPMVAPEYGYFNWYWTQDTVAAQTVVIHNYGSTSASGLVVLRIHRGRVRYPGSIFEPRPGCKYDGFHPVHGRWKPKYRGDKTDGILHHRGLRQYRDMVRTGRF